MRSAVVVRGGAAAPPPRLRRAEAGSGSAAGAAGRAAAAAAPGCRGSAAGVLSCAPPLPRARAACRRPVRAMASPPRVVAAAAAGGECPPGHVWVGVEELRGAMWRALKCFGHSDADAATLLDVRARAAPAARAWRAKARAAARRPYCAQSPIPGGSRLPLRSRAPLLAVR
jgi:hypothetical protein